MNISFSLIDFASKSTNNLKFLFGINTVVMELN